MKELRRQEGRKREKENRREKVKAKKFSVVLLEGFLKEEKRVNELI